MAKLNQTKLVRNSKMQKFCPFFAQFYFCTLF